MQTAERWRGKMKSALTYFSPPTAAAFHILQFKREMDGKVQLDSELSIALVPRGQNFTEDKKMWLFIKGLAITLRRAGPPTASFINKAPTHAHLSHQLCT